MEIASRKVIPPGGVGLTRAHPLANHPAMRKQPSAGLGPVTVRPTRSDLGPRLACYTYLFALHQRSGVPGGSLNSFENIRG